MPRTDTRALIIVDVQNDFCEGGSLAVQNGAAVATRIADWVRDHRHDYALIAASTDWHVPGSDNDGHISPTPDYQATWPAHCIAGTPGADFHPHVAAVRHLIDAVVLKGHGHAAYSAFDPEADAGDHRGLAALLAAHHVSSVDIVGIATDYCVQATAADALAAGLDVTVLTGMCAGVAPDTSHAALTRLAADGARIAGPAHTLHADAHSA